MIIFNGIREDNRGINITSIYEQEITVICKIIDGYSGLCSYVTDITMYPHMSYYFTHFVKVFHRRFEVWSKDESILYLRVDVRDDGSPNLETLDVYHKIKNFKYNNEKDQNPALPLYEIFCQNLYIKSHCKINQGDVVFDIGANVGFFSYFAICHGASKVYAFEPSSKSIAALRNNFSFPNLIAEEAAVSKYNGAVMFYYDDEHSIGSGMFSPELGNGIPTKSINLNEYILANKIDRINYLKIDCEGAEYEIIEDLSEDFLKHNVDNICVEYHFNTDNRLIPLLEKLNKYGFNLESEGGSKIIEGELGIFYAWK